jgi:hypothetical protein
MGFVAIAATYLKQFRRYQFQRRREKAYAARLAKVDRIGAAPYVPTARAAHSELPSAIHTLEESTRFGKIASPPPVPPRTRMARGSAPPPVPAAARPVVRRQPPAPLQVRFDARARRS